MFPEDRKLAVLNNFANNKAYICKKLGVISDADINRVLSDLKIKHKGKYGK